MPIWDVTPGQTKDTLARFDPLAGLGMYWCPLGGVGGSGQGQECLDAPSQTVAPGPGPGPK